MIYLYRCVECDIEFDLVVQGFLFTSPDMVITCPQCHESRSVHKVWKIPQVIYKGVGWPSKQGQNSGKD